MVKGTNSKSDMKTFSSPREFALAFAALLLPGVAGRLKKYDEMDARVQAGTAAHEREAAPIRQSADATIAAYANRKKAEASASSPGPHS